MVETQVITSQELQKTKSAGILGELCMVLMAQEQNITIFEAGS